MLTFVIGSFFLAIHRFGRFWLASSEAIVLSLQNCKLPTVNKFHITQHRSVSICLRSMSSWVLKGGYAFPWNLYIKCIVHDDSWSWYLVTDKARFFWGGGIGSPNLGQNRPPNKFFCYFLKFGSLVFFETAYNDSLQQCLTFSWGKIHKKSFWDPNLGQRGQSHARN